MNLKISSTPEDLLNTQEEMAFIYLLEALYREHFVSIRILRSLTPADLYQDFFSLVFWVSTF